jgi:hypothetical protein
MATQGIAALKRAAIEANKYFIEKGYVQAEPLYRWIEKDWLEKGIAEGAISFKNGQYSPKGYEIETEDVIQYRGRTPITEKKTRLDITKYLDFCRRYEKYKSDKDKQEFAVNKEMASLIQSEVKLLR